MLAFATVLFLGLLAATSARSPTPHEVRESGRNSDYEQFDGLPGSYKFHEFATTWWKASQICREEGAQLVVLDSAAELDAVQKMFARFPDGNVKGNAYSQFWAWVGIHERGVDRDFRTIEGAPVSVSRFLRWKTGYPRLPGASDCSLIERGSSLLADDPCERLYPFICEYTVGDEIDISSHKRKVTVVQPPVDLMAAPVLESTVELAAMPVMEATVELAAVPVMEATVELMAENVEEPMLEM